jgi:tripartite-type tricarboxylate transporter receptor subunit TctC
MIDTLFLTKPHVDQGKARALAQLGAHRSKNGADIPTMDESGLKGFNMSSWFILVAPTGTPKSIVDRLNALTNEIIHQPAVSEQFAKQGLELMGGSTQDAQRFLKEQVDRFGAAVKAANIKPN